MFRQPVGDVSAQAAELIACFLALQIYNEGPISLFTDSVYLSQIIAPLETASHVAPTSRIPQQLCCLQYLL